MANAMIRAMVRVDVRSRSKLLAALEAGQEQRRAHGELGYTLCINEDKRNMGYVFLDWESLQSLRKFIESSVAKEMAKNWPVVEIFEVILLRDIIEEDKLPRN